MDEEDANNLVSALRISVDLTFSRCLISEGTRMVIKRAARSAKQLSLFGWRDPAPEERSGAFRAI